MREFLEKHLRKPEIVAEAAQAQQGRKLWQEILIFIGVFWAASMAMSPVLMVGMVLLLVCSPEVISAFQSGNVTVLEKFFKELSNSQGYMIIMLFADIALIVIVILFAKLFQKRTVRTLGYQKKGAVREYLIGMAAGFAAFSAIVLLCVLTGALKITGLSVQIPAMLILLYFLGYLIQGMAEEVLCRGYFLVSVARRYSVVTAIFVNAIAFSALHLFNSGISVLALVNLTLFGIFASVYFVKRGNIWGVAAFHSIWNFVQGNFYGIQVSGMRLSSSIFTSEMAAGKEWINGGSFGLEGGIATTICMAAGIVLLLVLPQKENRRSE